MAAIFAKDLDGCAWNPVLSRLSSSVVFQSVKEEMSLMDKRLFAFQSGVEVAYKAVTKPVEGTILTVSRCAIGAKKKAEATNDAVSYESGLKEQRLPLLKRQICYQFSRKLVSWTLVVKVWSLSMKVSFCPDWRIYHRRFADPATMSQDDHRNTTNL